MKFYSEKLDCLFDTPEALEEAEAVEKSKSTKSKRKATAEQSTKTETKETESPTKKQLAVEVEIADELVKQAYADYESAKVKVEELSKKYLSDVNEILEPAQKAVKAAEQNRYDAIKKFNDMFGAYQVTYTGARAADDMIKAFSNINDRADKIFRNLFWF